MSNPPQQSGKKKDPLHVYLLKTTIEATGFGSLSRAFHSAVNALPLPGTENTPKAILAPRPSV